MLYIMMKDDEKNVTEQVVYLDLVSILLVGPIFSFLLLL